MVNLHHGQGISYVISAANRAKGVVGGFRSMAATLNQSGIEKGEPHLDGFAGNGFQGRSQASNPNLLGQPRHRHTRSAQELLLNRSVDDGLSGLRKAPVLLRGAPMTDDQAGCLGGLPVPLQQAIDTASRKLQGTTRSGDLLCDFAVIADQSQNDPLATSRSKPILTGRAPNNFPLALSILATQTQCGPAEFANRHGLLCAGC
jgi:hypothetical protein